MNVDYALFLAVLNAVCIGIFLLEWIRRRTLGVAPESPPEPDGDSLPAGPARHRAGMRAWNVLLLRAWNLLLEYTRLLFPVFLIVFLLRSFLVEPYRIPSSSMLPTLEAGDFILVSKFSYGLRAPVLNTRIAGSDRPERGDVIVFRYPEDPSIVYIKRVVGLPGERVTYRDKKLYINNELMDQTLLGAYWMGDLNLEEALILGREDLDRKSHEFLLSRSPPAGNVDVEVPEDHYYVLGDNRDHSQDSRFWGFVPDQNLVGRAFVIWMNWNDGIAWDRIGSAL